MAFQGECRVQRWPTHALLAAIALLALLIRFYYVRVAVVDNPLRGDAYQYFLYARNLVLHQTFSLTPLGTESPSPDSFRDPGYPAFLALIGLFKGGGTSFLSATLDLQSVMGAICTWAYSLLVRRWLGVGAAIMTGLLLAFWPQDIALTGYILSETLLGLLVSVALLTTDTAIRSERSWHFAAAGLTFALTSLTNAVTVPFAPAVAVVILCKKSRIRRQWAVFLLSCLVPILAWGLRTAWLPEGTSSTDRATLNFVQGSWPEYHPEYLSAVRGEPTALAHVAQMNVEYRALQGHWRAGIDLIGARFSADPGRYLWWYLSKPMELWGTSIGIAQNSFYVFPTSHSPLTPDPEAIRPLSWTTRACISASPMVALLALAGLALTLRSGAKHAVTLKMAAGLGFFVTCVFGILQSDARYATPYRGIEMALAAVALRAILLEVKAQIIRKDASAP